jgi:hypothetical protein
MLPIHPAAYLTVPLVVNLPTAFCRKSKTNGDLQFTQISCKYFGI